MKPGRMSATCLACYAAALCSDLKVPISTLRKMLHTTAGGRAILRRIDRRVARILSQQAEVRMKQKSKYSKHERWRCNARRRCAHEPK